MNRVIYLIALENVSNNAIFDTQVRKLLVGLKRSRGDSLQLTLLVLLPWIELTRRGMYSNFRRHRDDLARLKRELAADGIELVVSRTLFPSAFFNMKIAGLCCFTLLALPVVWYYVSTRRAGLIHCRYYYASFVALLASRLALRRVRVIFDVRTLLPEQGVVNRIWTSNGTVFRFWKRVEGWMATHADRVVSVAPAMTAWLEQEYPAARIESVTNFVDTDAFRRNDDLRANRRRELGIGDRTVLLYSGTVGGRYPADRMTRCVKLFFDIFGPDSFFLVLTSSDEKRLEPQAVALDAAGLKRGGDWQPVEASPADVPGYLSAADWSLLVLGDFLTSETFLPIKFAEYLAAGLPVLTHPRNTGIIAILEKYGIGAVLDPDAPAQQQAARLRENEDLMRARCIKTAASDFSLEHFVERYGRMYRELAGG